MMASRRQIAANRRNAQKSTGPRTLAGKMRSRGNAVRHGLTGETVIDVFENAHDYRAFERTMIREYRPRTLIERELVVRLSSLLWRLRRATAIETGLFSIQGRIIRDRKKQRDLQDEPDVGSQERLYEMLGIAPHLSEPGSSEIYASDQERSVADNNLRNNADFATDADQSDVALKGISAPNLNDLPVMHSQALAQCFLRVARLDDHILERVSRYETRLSRQVMQIVAILSSNGKSSLLNSKRTNIE